MKTFTSFLKKVYTAASKEFWNAPITTTSVVVGFGSASYYLTDNIQNKHSKFAFDQESLDLSTAILKELEELNLNYTKISYIDDHQCRIEKIESIIFSHDDTTEIPSINLTGQSEADNQHEDS